MELMMHSYLNPTIMNLNSYLDPPIIIDVGEVKYVGGEFRSYRDSKVQLTILVQIKQS